MLVIPATRAEDKNSSAPANEQQVVKKDKNVTVAKKPRQQSTIDKARLPKVAKNFQHTTKVLGSFVTGGGIIERIADNTIHFRSGDHIVIEQQTVVVLPGFAGQPLRLIEPKVLERGMTIGYSMRDGKIKKLVLTGIVKQPPTGATVFDQIKILGLRRGNQVNDGLDGRFPMRITGKKGEVSIKIGQTKLIELPKPTLEVQWRIGDYKPESIDDFEKFDYLLVQWRSNGRVTWTCYQSPAVAPANGKRERVAEPRRGQGD